MSRQGHGQRTAEEVSAASTEAFKGAVVGAAKVWISLDVHNSIYPVALLNFLQLLTIKSTR